MRLRHGNLTDTGQSRPAAARRGHPLHAWLAALALALAIASWALSGSGHAATIDVQGEIVFDSFTYTAPPIAGGQPVERCKLSWYVQFQQVPNATDALATLDNPNYGNGLEYPSIGPPPWNTVTHIPGGGLPPIVREAPDGMSWIPLDAFDTPGANSCATTLANTQGKWTLTSLRVEVAAAKGSITIVKETQAPATQGFLFAATPPINGFTLDTDPGSATPDRMTFSGLDEGGYSVSEILPDGWAISDLSCSDPSGGTTVDPGAATVTIGLVDDDHVTCTFSNEEEDNPLSLAVATETPQPQGVLRNQRIRYTLDAQSEEQASALSVIATVRTDLVDVDEASISGGGVLSADGTTIEWAFANTTGTDPPLTFEVTVRGDVPNTILFIPLEASARATLPSGDAAANTVKLVSLLTERSITIVKETEPATDPQDFSFTGGAPIGDFKLDTDPSSEEPDRRTFTDLDVGSYTVTESLLDGWELDDLDCTDSSGGTTTDLEAGSATIDLAEDDSVICTFHNRKATAPLVVNSTGDAEDETTGDNCDTGDTISRDSVPEPECTLRAAIDEANTRAGANTISFDIPVDGVPRIAPLSGLPEVEETASLEAATQPGGWVELSGTDAGDTANGIVLVGSESKVRGFVVNGFAGVGIVLEGDGEHVVAGNRIGTTVDGTNAAPNAIGIQGETLANTIGGLSAGGRGDPCLGDCNLVSGNTREGIQLRGRDNRIFGNFIGTDVTGTRALGNGAEGILGGGQDPGSEPPFADLLIGGPTADVGTSPGNLIAGNGSWTVHCTTCLIQGNLVGTDVTGMVALGGSLGIWMDQFASVGPRFADETRESVTPELRPGGNVISGHRATSTGGGVGVLAVGDTARVNGNFIGTTLDGLEALGNTVGIDTSISSPHASANVISGNRTGVAGARELTGELGRFSVGGPAFSGNFIGLNVRGDAAVPNGIGVDAGSGEIGGGISGSSLVWGGRPAGSRVCEAPCNVISGNDGAGIQIQAGTVVGNFIGTDGTGTRAIPNGRGVVVTTDDSGSRPRSQVGGESTALLGLCDRLCNLIAGNRNAGIAYFDDSSWTQVHEISTPHVIAGNIIGEASDGSALPNGEDGVIVSGNLALDPPGSGPDMIIGGLGQLGNRIVGNGAAGIKLVEVGRIPRRVTIVGNNIDRNAGIGIDLIRSGDAPGPSLTGLSTWQGLPVVDPLDVNTDGSVTVSGSVTVGGFESERIDVYSVVTCDPSGYGEGSRWLTSASTSGLTGTFSITIPSLPVGVGIAVTATDGEGTTSEFSRCITGALATTLTQSAQAGATRLEVASAEGLVGKVLEIGEGSTAERNYGAAAGSLVLAKKLRFAHAAGEQVVAVDDTLFVSVDRAVITRSAKLPDVAVLAGTLRAVAGRSIACGDDVRLTLDGGLVAQRVPGTRFVRQSGNRCVFVAKTDNGIGRVELDLRKGTWNAEILRRDLERLSNPVEVGLAIGDAAGGETLRFRETRSIWTYTR